MTGLLHRILGRLPIGWLQLWHNPTRLAAAIGGVMFANVLIFMQLGFMYALFDTSVAIHRRLDADLLVVGTDFQSLGHINPFPRARAWEALADPEIREMVPVYVSTLKWTDPDTNATTQFRVLGLPPNEKVFRDQDAQQWVPQLALANRVVLDIATRQLNPALVDRVQQGRPVTMEFNGIELQVVGTFRQGASFETDGHLMVSDDTFMRLFAGAEPGAPSLALLRTDPSRQERYATPHAEQLDYLAESLTASFPERDAKVMTLDAFVAQEHYFQGQQKPVGFVFMFGVTMGLVVGMVIVYQVLATDVQDHLKEYATFKAVGYSNSFFTSIILEEAISLAVLGFLPAFLLALVLYAVASHVTWLPIEMNWQRALFVLLLTFGMCSLAGVIAMRRLRSADPAELF